MKVIIAGSRSISSGPDSPVTEHNLSVLDDAVQASGFHTAVKNLHTYKGHGVRIGRGTVWGNKWTRLDGPTRAEFKVPTRAEAIERYREWFMEQPELIARLPELHGQTLLCYCHPAPCHGHFLAECSGRIDCVVSGTTRGVDRLGERWAKVNGIPVLHMPADWNQGRGAGYARNTTMAEIADAAIILHDGISRGTLHMKREMERLGKPVYYKVVDVADGIVVD